MTMIVSRRHFMIAAGATTLIAPAAHAEKKELRLVASGAFPPYNSKGPQNKIIGVYAEAMKDIFGNIGWTVDYQAFPWARGQEMVKIGDADGFITNPTPDRQSYALFAARPLVEVNLGVLIYRRNGPYAQAIETAHQLSDLKQLPTADYFGNGWGQRIWGDWPNVVRTADMAGIIRLLDGDRIAYAIKNTHVFMRRAQEMGLEDRFAVRHVDFIPDARNRFHLGLRRSLPGVAELMAAYEAAQRAYIAAGHIERLMLDFG